MGRQARAKRARREEANYAASLTRCEGTWLEHAPDHVERVRMSNAELTLRNKRTDAQDLGADSDKFNQFSLQMFRDERWNVLHFEDWVIESILEEAGEPPIVVEGDDPAFSQYLLRALGIVATPRFRRAIAEQARRLAPPYVEQGYFREGLAIMHNCYMTVMSDAATPLLVQMLIGGLSRWYDENEVEGEEGAAEATPETQA